MKTTVQFEFTLSLEELKDAVMKYIRQEHPQPSVTEHLALGVDMKTIQIEDMTRTEDDPRSGQPLRYFDGVKITINETMNGDKS